MSNSKQGGDLNDMAKDGTSIPGDAGKMNTIKSVPNPRQKKEIDELETNGGLGQVGAAVADNPTDIPRNPGDKSAAMAESITGMGDQMPGELGSKNLHNTGSNAMAKGSDRYDKHTKSNESEYDPKGVDETREMATDNFSR